MVFLIGQRGETLRSLQFMIATTLKNHDAALSRVNVDIADYKKHRYERLAEQVREWIEDVRSSGEPKHLVYYECCRTPHCPQDRD